VAGGFLLFGITHAVGGFVFSFTSRSVLLFCSILTTTTTMTTVMFLRL